MCDKCPEKIEVPVWWSNGYMMYNRSCLPSDHPENTYNYMVRVLKVHPEYYGIENPEKDMHVCPQCGHKFTGGMNIDDN